MDLGLGPGVRLVAQQRPGFAVRRAFDFVSIAFARKRPADLAAGQVARLFQIDLPPFRAAFGFSSASASRCADRHHWPAQALCSSFSIDELQAGLCKARSANSAAEAVATAMLSASSRLANFGKRRWGIERL